MLKKIAKFIIKYVDWIYLAFVSLFIVAYIASECGLLTMAAMTTIRGIIFIFSMVVLVCWFIAMYYMMHNKD